MKLFEYKQEIGKRRLEDFEVLSEVIEKNNAKGVAVKVFFYFPQHMNPQLLIKKTNSLVRMKRQTQGKETDIHCFFKKQI